MARDFNKVWGALYRANLAAKLKELGYSVSYTKKGELRLDAVSLEVEREFSGRRAQIQAKKELGARDMEAWRETRKDKDPQIVKAGVLAGWRDRVARHQHKTAEENRQDAVLNREQWFKEAQWSVEARQELAGERVQTEAGRWQVAARRATEHQARASSHAVITEYLTELARTETWDPITYTEAEQRLHEQVQLGQPACHGRRLLHHLGAGPGGPGVRREPREGGGRPGHGPRGRGRQGGRLPRGGAVRGPARAVRTAGRGRGGDPVGRVRDRGGAGRRGRGQDHHAQGGQRPGRGSGLGGGGRRGPGRGRAQA